jgi:cytochrome c peroxidase
VTEAAWTGQLAASKQDVADKLNGVANYRAAFQRAFKEDATPANIPQALSAFLRVLQTGDAPWDKFEGGDKKAVSKEIKHGHDVFEKARCTLCHVPPLYADSQFHNAGIGYAAGADGAAGTFADHGRMDASKDPADDGKFKTQPLREISRTGPYFHDGSAKSLEEAVDTMLAGGKPNPRLDEKLKPNKLSAKDRKALIAFLGSLNGKATFDSAPELP